MPPASVLRSVEDVTDTLTNRLPGPGLSALPALVLAILGNILVIVIATIAVALFVVAGLVVFGPGLIAML